MKKYPHNKINRSDEELIINDYVVEGLSLRKIMEKYSVSLNYLRRIFKEHNKSFRSVKEGIHKLMEKNDGIHPNSGEKCHFWKGGISKLKEWGPEFNTYLKEKIKERDNNCCKVCYKSIDDLNENQYLCIHHIDYNKQNNNINNLVTLCQSCHGKTNLNRNSWKLFFMNLCG